MSWTRGSKYSRAPSSFEAGSLAMHHMTTQGWFLSRAISSRRCCAWAACVFALAYCSEKVGNGGRPRHPADDAHVQSDGGRLVDDDDAVAVGEVEDLLGVGVVGGAEGVRADPLHELEVVDHERVVVALAADRCVFVLAEAGEVERLAVDEELVAAHLDGANADRDRVAVDDLVARDERRPSARRGRRRPDATARRPARSGCPTRPSPRATTRAGRIGEPHPHLSARPTVRPGTRRDPVDRRRSP